MAAAAPLSGAPKAWANRRSEEMAHHSRLRSDAALPGTGGGTLVESIDWLEIRHDERDEVVEVTRNALHYLRTLKQGIPTPDVDVIEFSLADPPEEQEADEALDGSQGITKRELLERQARLLLLGPTTAPRAAP